jgi:glycosyltransferase involved in cell wall biosynthesis
MSQRRLNVLFVTPWYPTEDHQYRGIFVREYAKAVRLHHDVTVLHFQADTTASGSRRFWDLVREDREELAEGIPTYRLHYRGIFFERGRSIILAWPMFSALRRVAQWHGRIDVIHAHVYVCGFYAVIVGKLCGIPTVVSEHSSGFPRRLISRIGRIEAGIAFRLADRVLPVSEALQKAIERYGLRADFRVVPNAVDADLFAPQARTESRNEPVRLLFVGGLIEPKGLPFLFQAMAQLQSRRRDLLLDVVGIGPELENYQRLTARLGLAERVAFHGTKSKQEVAEFFRRADLFVLPSLSETFSVATAEALTAGVPVLVTRCGGPEGLVTEKNGVLVPPQDAKALADALCTMLDRLESYDRREIAHAARERFGYEAVAAALDDVYSQVTGSTETHARANTFSNPQLQS